MHGDKSDQRDKALCTENFETRIKEIQYAISKCKDILC